MKKVLKLKVPSLDDGWSDLLIKQLHDLLKAWLPPSPIGLSFCHVVAPQEENLTITVSAFVRRAGLAGSGAVGVL